LIDGTVEITVFQAKYSANKNGELSREDRALEKAGGIKRKHAL
jgi:hypothetical protein